MTALAACCAAAVLLASSGCGEAQRNSSEPHRAYSVQLVRARFPAKQAIARNAALEIVVRNTSSRTIPNVAVTVDSLSYKSSYPELADRLRPVWVVNHGPGPLATPPPELESVGSAGGATTAFLNTWALGAVPPGGEKAFVWNVTPVKAGTHTVHYRVSAGLDGKAAAQLAGGAPAAGRFVVRVAPKPPATHVNPQTGAIVPGPSPTPAGPLPAAP